MNPSVTSAFNSFHNYLIPSTAERTAATQHRASIVSKLEDSFGVDYVYEIGSLGSGTGIHQHVDLDLMVSIPSYNQRDNSSNMLSAVKSALDSRFPYTSITVRTPAVRASFGSYDSEVVEIVPGYYQYQSQSSGSNVYKIPDFGGGWQLSAPRAHTLYVNEVNQKLNSKVKPLIRFVKAIKYYNNIPLSSFYLEMRVAKWCSTESSIEYAHDIKAFLAFLYTSELAALQDPTGIAGYIHGYSTQAKKEEALSKIATAYARASKAYDYGAIGQLEHAQIWWNALFDGKFSS